MTICTECGYERSDCDCSFISSDTLDVQGSGLTLNPFLVEPLLDPDEDNLLSCSASGLIAQLPSDILAPPQCQAYNSSNQSISEDDRTIIALNSERFDSASMHDNATENSRILIPIDGVYIITFTAAWAASALGDRGIYVRKNGSEYMGMSQKKAASSGETGLCVTVQDFFMAGEYIEGAVQQDGQASLNLLATRYSPVLTIIYRRRNPND